MQAVLLNPDRGLTPPQIRLHWEKARAMRLVCDRRTCDGHEIYDLSGFTNFSGDSSSRKRYLASRWILCSYWLEQLGTSRGYLDGKSGKWKTCPRDHCGHNWHSVSITSTKRVFLNSTRSEVDQKRNDDVEIPFLKIEIGDLVPTVW